MGNALVPALLLIAFPLAFLVHRLRLSGYASVRYATVALVAGVVALTFPSGGFDEPVLNRFKMLLAGGVAFLLFVRHIGALPLPRRAWMTCLASSATLSVVLYTDFFAFHGTTGFIHQHEMLHYYVGSKYFRELGYSDLYVALLAAGRENGEAIPEDLVARDLRSNRLVPAPTLLAESERVKAAFAPDRWRDFRADTAMFRAELRDQWPAVLVDHGYNPTPVWTLVGGSIANLVPAGDRTRLFYLALLDPALLVIGGMSIAWGFGVEAALLATTYFGLIFGTSFAWLGGGFLRQSWLVATVAAAACLRRGRSEPAGILLAFAALERVFPVFFAVPVVLRSFGQLKSSRTIERGTWRFILAFGVTLAALPLLSMVVLGTGAWSDFARNSKVYVANLGENVIGMTSLATVIAGRWIAGASDLSERLFDMRMLIQRAQLFVVAPLLLVAITMTASRLDDVTALALGVVLLFGTLSPACYYFGFLVLLLLARPERTARSAWLFFAEFVTYILTLFETHDDVIYLYRSAVIFWLLVIVLIDDFDAATERAFDAI